MDSTNRSTLTESAAKAWGRVLVNVYENRFNQIQSKENIAQSKVTIPAQNKQRSGSKTLDGKE